jgi:hypothetical protein
MPLELAHAAGERLLDLTRDITDLIFVEGQARR